MIDYSCIGTRIKAARKQKHITQEQLAERLSVTVGYVSQIERGVTKANLEMLVSIASVLDCDLSSLIEGASSGNGQYYLGELSGQIERMTPSQRKLLSRIADEILGSELN